MNLQDRYTVESKGYEGLPLDVRAKYDEIALRRIDGGIDSFLVNLLPSFPRFVQKLKDEYKAPVVGVLRTFPDDPIAAVFFDPIRSDRRPLISKPWLSSFRGLHSLDAVCPWLPPSVRCWYEFGDGLQWGDWVAGAGLQGPDFPRRVASRFSVKDYCRSLDLKPRRADVLYRKLGTEQVSGWLLTADEQALFVNESSQEGALYHVRAGNFEDVFALDEPAAVLDAYLSGLISGGPAPSLDFRRTGSEL